MTARGFYILLFGALMLLTALSVGSAGAFLLGAAALIAWGLALCSVLAARISCRMEQAFSADTVERGSVCGYTLRVRMVSLPLLAPLSLRLSLPSGRQSEFMLNCRLIGTTDSENAFPCPHVGVFPVGLVQVGFGDCFGLFLCTMHMAAAPASLTVLPCPIPAAPLVFSPGEGETTATQRAQADHTIPADTRAWQEGDELKRVHWKLSMRRQTLMVRTYETPQRPDALVLLNCALPQDAPRAALIDALTEHCAGVLQALLLDRHIARLSLPDRELSGQEPAALDALLRALAGEPFATQENFSRTLLLAARRMRRTGAAVILTAQLTPSIADAAIALSRTGPHTRLLLITPQAPTQAQAQLLRLLEASGLDAQSFQPAAKPLQGDQKP